MDEMTLALLGSLVEIRSELGPDVYEAAVDRARLALAAEVLVEAERRAIRARRHTPCLGNEGCEILAFPRQRTRC